MTGGLAVGSTATRTGSALRVVLAGIVLLYSAVHFFGSGVRFPLSAPNLGQVEEEMRPLEVHLETHQPVTSNNPRQYGPMFLLVLDPLLRWTHGDRVGLSNILYGLALALFIGSFAITAATLWPLVPPPRRPLAAVLFTALWLNFAPVYAILAVKNVEIWELFLMVTALYCLAHDRRAGAGISIGTAALMKLLPFAFFYWFLLRDRRSLVYAAGTLVVILVAAQALYGPEAGLWYLPHVFRSATGNSWGLLWHENVSIKGMLIKLFGHLEGTLNPKYAGLAHGGSGHAVVISSDRLAIVQRIGTVIQAAGGLWLTWMILNPARRTGSQRLFFEWSLVSVMLLILSPQTAFEYCTLALGAFSYVLVRLVSTRRPGWPAVMSFAGAVFLVANVVPRSIVARMLFIDRINRMNMIGQLSPVEGFQYYGFPLAGLVLLVVSLCALRATSSDFESPTNSALPNA